MTTSGTSGFNTGGLGYQSRHSRVGMRYPSPFFDLSQYYFPQNPRSLFKFAAFYAQTFGPVYAFVTKMSSYALTDLVWGSDASSKSGTTDSEWKSRWEYQVVENMRIYDMAYQLGLHYWTYGNFYASVFYPFVRWLICPQCGHRKRAKDFPKKGYRWANYRFHGQCPGCSASVTFRVRDQMVRTTRGLRIINWNPERMLVVHNEATAENEYKYQPSEILLRRIRRGDRKVIESTPWPFIKAAKISGYVDIDPSNLLHVRAPSPAGNSMGMGHPPIMAALKDIFHVQLMKRAQEANAIERTIPMSVIHPAPMPGTTWDPIQTVNLRKMIEHTQEEILHGRQDPNYQAVTALPLGRTDLWGEGKNLMLVPEIRGWTELIIADMAVPNEFIFGGLQFCMTPGTYVHTDKGLLRLDELEEREARTITTHEGVSEIALVHHTGNKKVTRLEFRTGLDAVSSPDHRYLVLNKDMSTEWRKACELEPGDFVASKLGRDLWPEEIPDLTPYIKEANRVVEATVTRMLPGDKDVELPETLTPELARLMGYLVSEGSCTEDRRIGFVQNDIEIIDDFLNCVEVVFGYRPNPRLCSVDPAQGKDYYSIEIGRRRAVAFLHALGVVGYSHEKVVPEIIRRSPKGLVTDFLSSLFEGDGSIEDVTEKQMLSYGSKSEKLLKEVQLLLQNLGILSSRYDYRETSDYTGCCLQIRSYHIDLFAEKIGFRSTRKRSTLSARTRTGRTDLAERVPYLKDALDVFRRKHYGNRSAWSWQPFSPNLTEEEYDVQELATVLGISPSMVAVHVREGRLVPSRETLYGRGTRKFFSADTVLAFCEEYGRGRRGTVPGRDAYGMTYTKLANADLTFIRKQDSVLAENIESLKNAQYTWVEVQTVEESEQTTAMMDLTVDGHHSYIADGLVTHNSGSNVSLRMLENQILTFTGGYKRLTRFVVDRVARFLRWPTIPWAWTPFKMADDIQLKQHLIMLSQMNKIGDSTLLGSFSKNPDEEHVDIQKSLARQSKYQEIQLLGQTRTQLKAQKIQQEAMEAQQAEQAEQMAEQSEQGAEQVPVDGEEGPQQFAQRMAMQLQGQPPEVVQQVLQSVGEQSPELAQMIMSILQQQPQQAVQQPQQAGMGQQPPPQGMAGDPQQQMAQQQMAQQQQMMQPMPQQLPPRRGPGSASI